MHSPRPLRRADVSVRHLPRASRQGRFTRCKRTRPWVRDQCPLGPRSRRDGDGLALQDGARAPQPRT